MYKLEWYKFYVSHSEVPSALLRTPGPEGAVTRYRVMISFRCTHECTCTHVHLQQSKPSMRTRYVSRSRIRVYDWYTKIKRISSTLFAQDCARRAMVPLCAGGNGCWPWDGPLSRGGINIDINTGEEHPSCTAGKYASMSTASRLLLQRFRPACGRQNKSAHASIDRHRRFVALTNAPSRQ
jgi:hypothetical protein